jgi:REP element-mobilizing transposase RayT
MPAAKPLQPGKYYHIYNRGNNRENLFHEERNYAYFLRLYAFHIEPIAETFAYCLLKNHFHLLIKVKDLPEIQSRDFSQPFSNLFNAYTKSINKAYQRSGSLFQRPFGRILVTSDAYFKQLITYNAPKSWIGSMALPNSPPAIPNPLTPPTFPLSPPTTSTSQKTPDRFQKPVRCPSPSKSIPAKTGVKAIFPQL